MSNKRASYQRARTTTVKTNDLDFMVLSYTQHDDAVLTSLGRHCHETKWLIAAGMYQPPIEILVTCDKGVATSPQVGLVVDGKTERAKAALKEDYQWSMPFRSSVKHLGKKKYFQIRPAALGTDHWFPATLTKQHDDGYFTANVEMPDGHGGIKEVDFPGISKENIREAQGDHKHLELPSSEFVLDIPKKEPMHATLSHDDEKLTHNFVRYTPAPKVPMSDPKWLAAVQEGKPKIKFSVSKDRKEVTTDVGATTFNQFVKGEIFGVSQEATSHTKHCWKIQIGPFEGSQHTLEIERKHPHKASKVISLTVDGELLVESSAQDLESPEGYWVCQFRFVGERCLEWDVYESDGSGRSLDTKGIVTQPQKFSVQCQIYFNESMKELEEAKLYIDDRDFTELREPFDASEEPPMTLELEALKGSWDLIAPYKCKESLSTPSSAVKPHTESGGLLACCCQSQATTQNDVVIAPMASSALP